MKEVWRKNIGKRRVAEFEKLSLVELCGKVECRTIMIYGEEELKFTPSFVKSKNVTDDNIKNGQTIVVEGIAHDATNPAYISALLSGIAR